MWIRGDGEKDARGRFMPSGEVAWFDFERIDPSQFAEGATVPLRIACRAMARPLMNAGLSV